jgi:hypothetical protein
MTRPTRNSFYRQCMTTFGIVVRSASRPRRIVFTLVAGIVSAAFLNVVPLVLAPWRTVNIEGLSDPAQARWGLALEGGVDLLAVIFIVGALLRPARSALLVQYVLYAALLAAAVVTPFNGPIFLIVVGLLLLVPLTYPYPRELFSLRSQRGPSVRLLTVAVIAAAVLIPLAVQAIRIQATIPHGTGPDSNGPITNAEHLLLLAVAGLMAATRRPGWRVIASAVTAAYAYLGLASILLPNQPSSWGTAGGAASLLASAAFGITALIAARGNGSDTTEPKAVPPGGSSGAPEPRYTTRHALGMDR